MREMICEVMKEMRGLNLNANSKLKAQVVKTDSNESNESVKNTESNNVTMSMSLKSKAQVVNNALNDASTYINSYLQISINLALS